ncbi:MAG: hypothetical protein JOZ29_11065, partial [Deltaproteobacteria bacterium]|nr:hypothetical protein [Deltaproteobacteria bacterium]
DTLSFEYRSVALARHWFKPEVFYSRFWRLPPDLDPLSDGSYPPKGAWPAYTVAVVLMRNIQLTMRADHPAPPQLIRTLPALRYLAVEGQGAAGLGRLAPAPITTVVRPAQPIKPLQPAIMHAPVQLTPSHFAVMAPIRPMVAPGVAIRPMAPIARIHPPIAVTPRPFPPATPPPPAAPPVHVPPPPVAASPTPAPTSVTDPKKDISIFAFICARLPKTPNPDPNLDWGCNASR